MAALTPGSVAPDFTAPDQDDRPWSLGEHRGSYVLVYFYPKADTPGCTTQACAVRDSANDFPADLEVVGVSPDLPGKQAKFAAKYELGFPLLSDPDHAIADLYGAWGERSMYGRKFMGMIRSAALIAPDGAVVTHWPKISPKDTVPKALAALAAHRG